MTEQYKCLPSQLLDIEDNYTAFCFNEACSYILAMLKEGKKPNYSDLETDKKIVPKHYTSMKDFYKELEVQGVR